MSRSRIYKIWQNLDNRCNFRTHTSFKHYGGKGIRTEWKNFEEFFADMGKSYETHVKKHGEKNTSIDRIDNNKNYSRANCRWATWGEQGRNTSRNVFVKYKGKAVLLISLARNLGLNPSTVSTRYLRRGWTLEQSLKPIEPCTKYFVKIDRKRLSLADAAKLKGVPYHPTVERFKRGLRGKKLWGAPHSHYAKRRSLLALLSPSRDKE